MTGEERLASISDEAFCLGGSFSAILSLSFRSLVRLLIRCSLYVEVVLDLSDTARGCNEADRSVL
jgi:hypothetical protein